MGSDCTFKETIQDFYVGYFEKSWYATYFSIHTNAFPIHPYRLHDILKIQVISDLENVSLMITYYIVGRNVSGINKHIHPLVYPPV